MSAIISSVEPAARDRNPLNRIPKTMTHAQAVTFLAVVVSTGVFALTAYSRRWMSDDGLISVRQARELIEGHGFSYNSEVRGEASTSALWALLLALLYAVVPGDPSDWAVALGLVLSVWAIAIGLDGSRRLLRSSGAGGALVPFGVLVLLAVPTFQDFATSGLETSLSYLWLAGSWRLLVMLRPESRHRRQLAFCLIIGLGDLVRPEFAAVSLVFFAAAFLILRPGRRQTLTLAGTTIALPLAYEVFRAGYYGVLVPSPAMAKEAGMSDWSRGLAYLQDFTTPYVLWIPILAVFGALGLIVRRHLVIRRDRIAVGAPVVAGVLLALYVLEVGGDYMHGRMWLPPLLLILLPAFLAPVTTRALRVVAAVCVTWAVIAAATSSLPYSGEQFGPAPLLIADERSFYATAGNTQNPVGSENHTPSTRLWDTVRQVLAEHRRYLVFVTAQGEPRTVPLAANRPESIVVYAGSMGIAGVVVPLDGGVSDVAGIVSPLSAHLVLSVRGRAGHEKHLPLAWALAEYGDRASVDAVDWGADAPSTDIAAARHALTCGAIKQLLDATEKPLTPSRFWDNLIGAPAMTSLRIPPDPVAAEKMFCR